VVTALAVICTFGCSENEQRGTAQRDVLLVTVDTLRAASMSLYGYGRPTTPQIDRWFAEDSRIYERAYATEANTSPSIISILTGLYPRRHGVRLLYQKIPTETVTLPDVISAAGYETAAFVSNIVLADEAIALAPRFDHYDDHVDEPSAGWKVFERRAARTTDAALAWLRARDDPERPHFVWVHYIDPHGPYSPPSDAPADFTHEGSVPVSADRLQRAHVMAGGGSDGLEYVDRYDEEIAYADREIGRLLDGYHSLVDADEAIILFTADHGETMMEFEQWFRHGYHVYEPIVRVPLMLRAPGVTPGHEATPISLVNVMPTLLELAGVSVPEGLDGRSAAVAVPRGPVFSEATSQLGQWRALIDGDEKLIAGIRPGGDIFLRQRYTVDAEPHRSRWIPWDEDESARAFSTEIAADPDVAGIPTEFRKRMQRGAPKVVPDLDADTLKKLEALGYVDSSPKVRDRREHADESGKDDRVE
jgi:arylsulfatase A-like enzyme